MVQQINKIEWNELFASRDEKKRDPRKAAELIELFVRLDARNKYSFRGQISNLAKLLSSSYGSDDQQQRGTALSALVFLVEDDVESQDELRTQTIGDDLVSVLSQDADPRTRVHALMLLGVVTLDPNAYTISETVVDGLIAELRHSDVRVKELAVRALSNIAITSNGAQIIGCRGEMIPLLQLLNTETSEALKRLVLQALSKLVKDSNNGSLFIYTGGLAKFEAYVQQVPDTDAKDLLASIHEMISENDDLACAMATNKTILNAFLQSLADVKHPDLQRRASAICYELIEKDKRSIETIDSLKGFQQLASAVKATDGNLSAERALVSAIRILLGDCQPDDEPPWR